MNFLAYVFSHSFGAHTTLLCTHRSACVLQPDAIAALKRAHCRTPQTVRGTGVPDFWTRYSKRLKWAKSSEDEPNGQTSWSQGILRVERGFDEADHRRPSSCLHLPPSSPTKTPIFHMPLNHPQSSMSSTESTAAWMRIGRFVLLLASCKACVEVESLRKIGRASFAHLARLPQILPISVFY